MRCPDRDSLIAGGQDVGGWLPLAMQAIPSAAVAIDSGGLGIFGVARLVVLVAWSVVVLILRATLVVTEVFVNVVTIAMAWFASAVGARRPRWNGSWRRVRVFLRTRVRVPAARRIIFREERTAFGRDNGGLTSMCMVLVTMIMLMIDSDSVPLRDAAYTVYSMRHLSADIGLYRRSVMLCHLVAGLMRSIGCHLDLSCLPLARPHGIALRLWSRKRTIGMLGVLLDLLLLLLLLLVLGLLGSLLLQGLLLLQLGLLSLKLILLLEKLNLLLLLVGLLLCNTAGLLGAFSFLLFSHLFEHVLLPRLTFMQLLYLVLLELELTIQQARDLLWSGATLEVRDD